MRSGHQLTITSIWKNNRWRSTWSSADDTAAPSFMSYFSPSLFTLGTSCCHFCSVWCANDYSCRPCCISQSYWSLVRISASKWKIKQMKKCHINLSRAAIYCWLFAPNALVMKTAFTQSGHQVEIHFARNPNHKTVYIYTFISYGIT